MDETYRDSMHEHVLDNLFEGFLARVIEGHPDYEGFSPDFFGEVDKRPAMMYVSDPEGNCWEVTATPHPHH